MTLFVDFYFSKHTYEKFAEATVVFNVIDTAAYHLFKTQLFRYINPDFWNRRFGIPSGGRSLAFDCNK
jgi:hypothetical protein